MTLNRESVFFFSKSQWVGTCNNKNQGASDQARCGIIICQSPPGLNSTLTQQCLEELASEDGRHLPDVGLQSLLFRTGEVLLVLRQETHRPLCVCRWSGGELTYTSNREMKPFTHICMHTLHACTHSSHNKLFYAF